MKQSKSSGDDFSRGMEAWLSARGVINKDAEDNEAESDEFEARIQANKRLAALKPQASIDLHGMTASEARLAVEAFLTESIAAGCEKVAIITGKGNHSDVEPVLGRTIRHLLEASPHAGRFGFAKGREGGTGTLWVNLRVP